MKQYRDMTAEEQRVFDESLLTGEEPLGIDPALPDGTLYEWDPTLRVTLENTPDGRRFVVELWDGKLTRIRELVPKTPAIAV
jgi:hypothetical protein